VGIGNRLRGDDGFGPLLVDHLRGCVGWPLVDAGETPENHIGRIVSFSPERVLLLDAVAWGSRPGGIGFFPGDEIPFDGVCTHSMSLRLFADMLTARADCAVGLLGIQPKGLELGRPLSAEVESGVGEVAACLIKASAGGAYG